MKTYIGLRNANGPQVVIASPAWKYLRLLPLHSEIVNHSPTGFEWGYGGSGPAQLALAILADVLGPKKRLTAEVLHQSFKWDFVAKWADGWRITEDQIRAWVHRYSGGMKAEEQALKEGA